MSWFGSIVNSLKLDDDDAVSEPGEQKPLQAGDDESALQSPPEGQQGRGVKEDLEEITKTLTRQFWGVASFLAPPPPPQSPPKSDSKSVPESSEAAAAGIDGIRSDFAEIGGRFKSGITKLSGAKAVSEFSKIASNILQIGLDQGSVGEYESGSAIGVTEEVVAFAKNISLYPETWLDFPLADDDDQEHDDDFDMSDAQQEHALAVERLVPELAAIRFELCPEYMREGFFWKIYFVLVHPRLDKHAADLISTPQILETRAMLTQKLQKRREAMVEEGDGSHRNKDGASLHEISLSGPSNAPATEVALSHSSALDVAASKPLAPAIHNHPYYFKDMQMVDRSVVTEGSKELPEAQNSSPAHPSSSHHDTDEDDGDDWLKEEPSEAGAGNISGINIPVANDEDVSFSDLEEEDDTDVPVDAAKKAAYGSDSSTKSPDWVQLSRSSSDSPKVHKLSDVKHSRSPNKDSNDWLKVEDIDEM